MANPFIEDLKRKLSENPDECYVTDQYIAVLIDDTVVILPGDFKDASPEAINEHIVNMISHLTKK